MKKRRLISLVVLVALIFSSFTSFAQDEESVSKGDPSFKVHFTDDFEGYNAGATSLSGYGGGNKGNIWKVVNEKGTKAFYMEVNTTSDMHLDKTFSPPVSENIIIQADVSCDHSQTEKLFQIRDSNVINSEFCRFVGNRLMLYDGTIVGGFVAGKTYRLAISVDFKNFTFDLYFNGKRRVTDYPMQANSQNLAMLRIHMRYPKGKSSMNIDNLKIYSASKPLSDAEFTSYISNSSQITDAPKDEEVKAEMSPEELKLKMKNALGMYMDKPNAMVKGEKTYITPDRKVKPYFEGETPMVPVEFFVSSLGIKNTVLPDGIKVEKDGKILILTVNKDSIDVNGVQIALPTPVVLKDGVIFAPVYELCDSLDLYLFLDFKLLIASENNLNLSWENCLTALRRLNESFIYDDVSAQEILDNIDKIYADDKHPRMLMTEEKFKYVRDEVAKGEAGDVVVRKMYENIVATANSMLDQDTNFYDIYDGVRLLSICHSVENIVLTCAMAYNITLDEKYAIRARREMIAACSFKDWHPYHMLDVGVMTSCIGIAYDWLYDYLDEQDKAFIRKAIIEKGLKQIKNDHDHLTITGNDQSNLLVRSWLWNRVDPICNWRFIAGGGCGTGALAILTELTNENDISLADGIIQQTLKDIRPAISLFSPDGGYEESMSYWEYSCRYFTQYVSSIDTSTGSDYGYYDAPGLEHATEYLTAMTGPASIFSYHDSSRQTSGVAYAPTMIFAKKFGRYGEAQNRIDNILTLGGATYKDMYSYDPVLLTATDKGVKNYDTMLKTAGLFSARSGFDKNALWVAMHSDQTYAGPSHDHDDAGTFVLDAMGENFFFDLGMDNYNLPNYQKLTYRTRAEGHNMLLINPDYVGNPNKYENFHDVKYGANATIDKYVTKPRGAFAITNVSELYEADVESAWRGVKLDNYRRTVTIQDEVVMKKPGEIYWFAHTEGQIEVAPDGKSATVELNGKKLLCEIAHGDGATFSVLDAVPLPSSPKVEGQNSNAGIKKLTIHVENTKELNLMVVMNPLDDTYDEESYSREFIPLDKWEIEDGEYTELEYAYAKDIKVNGESVKNFNKDTTYYKFMVSADSTEIPTVEVDTDFEYEIENITTPTGDITIKLKRKGDIQGRTYTISVKPVNQVGIPKDATEIKPVSVRASNVPQSENSPENTLDGDLTTRWSCDGLCWIEYDLGKVVSLDGVAIAFRWSDLRTAHFSVSVSTDGKSFTETFNGDSTPIEGGMGYEYSKTGGKQARYIRIDCRGWNGDPKAWTSILDVRTFTK